MMFEVIASVDLRFVRAVSAREKATWAVGARLDGDGGTAPPSPQPQQLLVVELDLDRTRPIPAGAEVSTTMRLFSVPREEDVAPGTRFTIVGGRDDIAYGTILKAVLAPTPASYADAGPATPPGLGAPVEATAQAEASASGGREHDAGPEPA